MRLQNLATLARISSAVFVQTNGFRFSLYMFRYSRMAGSLELLRLPLLPLYCPLAVLSHCPFCPFGAPLANRY